MQATVQKIAYYILQIYVYIKSTGDQVIAFFQAEYIRDKQLAGAMVWSLDLDDFKEDLCGQGKYPLLRKIATILGLPATPHA